MIGTNQARIHFDHETIQRNFIIFEAKRDTGNYSRSKVPDIAVQECQALAVAYDWGNTCYILYRRQDAEKCALKQTLERYGEDDVRIEEISSEKMYKNRLAQLLFNAIPNLSSGGEIYHNVTGKLFYSNKKWVHKRKGGAIYDFFMLQISITWDCCIKLEVRTFSPAFRSDPGEPQYLYDSKSYVLRRMLKKDPDKASEHFVLASAYPGKKNCIPFVGFKSIEDYYSGKTGVLHKFLKDVRDFLFPYLTLDLVSLDEAMHIGEGQPDRKMTVIRQRLQQIPLYLEDAVQNEQSAILAAMMREEFEQRNGIPLLAGTPPKGSGLIRIIHNEEYYAGNSEPDPHLSAPKDCIVQHVTVEDFQLTDKKENANLRKIIQELAIKADVYERRISCYDWPSQNFSSAITFVTAQKKTNQSEVYYRLHIQPDGSLQFDSWVQSLLPADEEKEKISLIYHETKNGKFDWKINGLLYENANNILVIRETDRFALPDMEELEKVLKATNDWEPLPAAPIIAAVQSHCDTLSDKEQEKCEQILGTLSSYGTHILRRDVRITLDLGCKLGRELNQLIFEKTNILISDRMKRREERERLFGGALDIRLFCEEQAQYYFSGIYGSALKDKLSRACRIRKVTTTGTTLQFEKYLPLLEVDFIRVNGWTVLPFPFKYLREWQRTQR